MSKLQELKNLISGMKDSDIYMLDLFLNENIDDETRNNNNYTSVNDTEWLQDFINDFEPMQVFTMLNNSRDRGFNVNECNSYFRFYGDLNAEYPDYIKTSDNCLDLIDLDLMARYILKTGNNLDNDEIYRFLHPENVKRDNFVMDRFMKVV